MCLTIRKPLTCMEFSLVVIISLIVVDNFKFAPDFSIQFFTTLLFPFSTLKILSSSAARQKVETSPTKLKKYRY